MTVPFTMRDHSQQFRQRAAKLRSLAELTIDIEARALLLRCADDYEAMAAKHATGQSAIARVNRA